MQTIREFIVWQIDRVRARWALWLLSLVITVGACRPAQAPTTEPLEAVYALGCVALEVADAGATTWIDSLDAPTTEQLTTAAQAVAALEVTRAALEIARAALVRDDAQAAQAALVEALGALTKASEAPGDRAPPGLATALQAAQDALP